LQEEAGLRALETIWAAQGGRARQGSHKKRRAGIAKKAAKKRWGKKPSDWNLERLVGLGSLSED
jgi:hypothetical protein